MAVDCEGAAPKASSKGEDADLRGDTAVGDDTEAGLLAELNGSASEEANGSTGDLTNGSLAPKGSACVLN